MGLRGLSSYSDRMRERKVLTSFCFLHPQPPNLIHTPAGARVLSGLHLPPHTPRWPPLLLCVPRQCLTTSDNLPSGLPRPPRLDPQGQGGQPWLISLPLGVRACVCVCGCMCVCVCWWGTPAAVPLLVLGLLYLINVIYSWNSVRVERSPRLTLPCSPHSLLLLLALDPAAPVRPHFPSSQLRPEGKTQVPVCLFFYLACPGISHLLLSRR